MKQNTRRAVGAILLLALAGCRVGPDYRPPAISMPDQWHQQLTEGFAVGEAMPGRWWELLNDPVLNEIIDQVRRSNPDLHSAYWVLAQARYARDVAAGAYDPSVDAVGAWQRTRLSENSNAGAFSSRPFNAWTAGFDASWESNVFGRVSRAVESAQASYEASIEQYRDVRVSLSAEAARYYIELRTVQTRLAYARTNLASQAETLALAQARFDAELSPRLDVEQARLNVAETRAHIPPLVSAEQAAIHRLSILTGRRPGELSALLAPTRSIPEPPATLALRVPAELLRQRPDVRAAERQLAAQSARVGVATAELYPSFALSGSIGFDAQHLSDLTDSASRRYGFGPSFRWNLFSGNRVRNQIRIEESRTEQWYWQYRSTVLAALEDVENAIADYVQQRLRQEALTEAGAAADASVRLVTAQYKNGLTDFQDVLILQRSLLAQQDKLAETRGQVVQNLVRMYKALGGWGDDVAAADESNGQVGEPARPAMQMKQESE